MQKATEFDATELIPPDMVEGPLSLQDVFDLGKEKLEEFIKYWQKELATEEGNLQAFMDGRPSAWTSWHPDSRFGAAPEYMGLGRYVNPTFHTFSRTKLSEDEKTEYDNKKRHIFEVKSRISNLVSLRELHDKITPTR